MTEKEFIMENVEKGMKGIKQLMTRYSKGINCISCIVRLFTEDTMMAFIIWRNISQPSNRHLLKDLSKTLFTV